MGQDLERCLVILGAMTTNDHLTARELKMRGARRAKRFMMWGMGQGTYRHEEVVSNLARAGLPEDVVPAFIESAKRGLQYAEGRFLLMQPRMYGSGLRYWITTPKVPRLGR